MVLAWTILGLSGPFGAWRYSTSLTVAGDRVLVRKAFGARQFEFRREDVRSAAVKRKGSIRHMLRMDLVDGRHIEVDHWAQGFDRLLDYFGLETPGGE
jgi:hypothetical protein